jgi:hypothetical protein
VRVLDPSCAALLRSPCSFLAERCTAAGPTAPLTERVPNRRTLTPAAHPRTPKCIHQRVLPLLSVWLPSLAGSLRVPFRRRSQRADPPRLRGNRQNKKDSTRRRGRKAEPSGTSRENTDNGRNRRAHTPGKRTRRTAGDGYTTVRLGGDLLRALRASCGRAPVHVPSAFPTAHASIGCVVVTHIARRVPFSKTSSRRPSCSEIRSLRLHIRSSCAATSWPAWASTQAHHSCQNDA